MPLVLDTSLLTIDGVLSEIVEEIAGRSPRCGATTVIAIDGGAGAGKTTLTGLLAAGLPDASVLHTDDLLAGWDDQFTFWPRLRAEVLAPIARGEPGRFDGFDWVTATPSGPQEVAVTPTLLVEGVSAIAACADYASLGVFYDLPRAVREQRWAARDQMPVQAEWVTWLDREDVFFATHPPAADIIVRGP